MTSPIKFKKAEDGICAIVQHNRDANLATADSSLAWNNQLLPQLMHAQRKEEQGLPK
jgi:hypothetical protein